MPQGVDRNTVERVKAEVMRRERSRAYSSNSASAAATSSPPSTI